MIHNSFSYLGSFLTLCCLFYSSHYCSNFDYQFCLFQKPPKLTLDKLNSRRSAKIKKEPGQVPWKGSDPVPKDTWRYNYLENNEVVKDVHKL